MWLKIRHLRADPTDQVLISVVYFFLAISCYLRPEGRLFMVLKEIGVSNDFVGFIFTIGCGALFRSTPMSLWRFLICIIPLSALVSYVIWFILRFPDTSFLTAIPSMAFLASIIKNSFFQRGR